MGSASVERPGYGASKFFLDKVLRLPIVRAGAPAITAKGG